MTKDEKINNYIVTTVTAKVANQVTGQSKVVKISAQKKYKRYSMLAWT